MDANGRTHHTRSMAGAQEFTALVDSERKVKPDKEEEKELNMEIINQANDSMLMLQQLMAKQDVLLEENKQLRQEMVVQRTIINNLSKAVETIQETKAIAQNTSVIKLLTTATDSVLQPIASTNKNEETHLREQAAKQLQSKRINQLLDSAPFTGSSSQEVSDWIEDFVGKCDQLRLDDAQRLAVATDLLRENAKLWYETHKDTINNWTTLKCKLTSYFQLVTGTDHFQLEQKLYNRRRQTNELAIDYCHNVLKLCTKVNKEMDEKIRLRHLQKGLDSAAQRHMDLKNPATTEEFLQALVKYDKWQEEDNRPEAMTYQRRDTTTATNPYPIPRQGQSQVTPHQQYNYPSNQQSRHPGNVTLRSTRHEMAERRYDGCWSCGGMDHFRSECPKNY
jgi:ElaB/YqjD/DUF883 family membrane-anchored ribosome-binding protein